MSGKRTFIELAITTALGVVAAASLASAQQQGYLGGDVLPCSLAGVNPADHPSIFGNPEVARQQYGFVQGPDGNWQVIPNCESIIQR
jgi:hypothetical protein